jgi:glutamyl-tRNA synthetase
VTVQNRVLDDMIILRADGSPTYMLAVVVDDHDMGVTHVIRGDDHLNNAFRQYMVYRGMGWEVPVFAHIPLIHGSDGAKLSKRHGALGVDAYRDMGFLPDAMFSYLLRLGWSHGDQDIFTRDEATALFDLGHVGKSPARFDLDKLYDVNSQFLRQMDEAVLCDMILDIEAPTSPDARARLLTLMPLLKERARTHLDIVDGAGYLLHDGAVPMAEEAASLLDDAAKARLLSLDQYLQGRVWRLPDLKQAVDEFMAENSLKMRDIGLPLRAALTGSKQSPSIIDIMAALGATETSRRIRSACDS